MVSFWKSAILLNRGGGRVGEQSVPFEDRDSKVEDSLPKGFFFFFSFLICLDLHSSIYVESTEYSLQICFPLY